MKWFKKIKNTNFSIDIVGNVLNNNTYKIMRPGLNKNGYYKISTRNKNDRLGLLVHREVAKLFCDNKNNLPIVNHIDGNKLNNHASNLEWCTVQENTIHAYDIGLNSLAVKVKLIDLKTNITKEYTSIQRLGKSIGVDGRTLIGRIKRSKKYPISGRYVIEILDDTVLLKYTNSLNFGIVLYVYDYLTNETTKYNSLGQAMYVTGIRNPTYTSSDVLLVIGFIVSFKPISEITDNGMDKESIKLARDKYYSKDYKKRSTVYYVVDLLSEHGEEHVFITIKDLRLFISKVVMPNILDINLGGYKNFPGTNSKLIRGFSITAIDSGNETPRSHVKITYERALNSREMRAYNRPVYKVTISGVEYIISTTIAVLDFLRKYIPRNHRVFNVNVGRITDNIIQDAISRNDIRISRLNKIMI